MEISEQSKIQILLTLLGRRYDGVERIRDRVYSITIWTLGVFLAATSLIVEGSIQLGLPEKIFLALVVVFALVVILFYIKDLERGFRNQFQVATRIEKLLGFYEQGTFDLEEGLYPSEWTQTGTKLGRGRFFRNTYLLLYLGATVLIAAIWLSGWSF